MQAKPNPSGLCLCGCGETTPLAAANHTARGHVKGEHVRYAHRSHAHRAKGPDYAVEDRGYETPCWIWLRSTIRGYGQIRGGLAHRAYYERLIGPISLGLELDHLCRIPACINPAHMEPVTHAENMRRSPITTKLSPAEVREIRASTESTGDLCRRYGISSSTVSAIRSGVSWIGV